MQRNIFLKAVSELSDEAFPAQIALRTKRSLAEVFADIERAEDDGDVQTFHRRRRLLVELTGDGLAKLREV